MYLVSTDITYIHSRKTVSPNRTQTSHYHEDLTFSVEWLSISCQAESSGRPKAE